MEKTGEDNIAIKLNEKLRKQEAKVRDKTYLAKYHHGLMQDTILHLAAGEDPVKAALAEYRRCSGETSLLSPLDAATAVKSVEPITLG